MMRSGAGGLMGEQKKRVYCSSRDHEKAMLCSRGVHGSDR